MGAIGDIAFQLPDLHVIQGAIGALQDPAVHSLLPQILVWSASVALLSSLDALLCSKVMERITRLRSDSNFDLIRLGIGNTIRPCSARFPAPSA